MIKQDILIMAMKNLNRRKGRTFLTMLGVVIGTTSMRRCMHNGAA